VPGANVGQLRRFERETLVDPCFDFPAEHFEIGRRGNLIPRSPRGERTIDILDLNRSQLSEERGLAVHRFVYGDLSLEEKVRCLLPGSPFPGASWLALMDLLPPDLVKRNLRKRPERRRDLRRLITTAFGRKSELFDDVSRPSTGRRRYIRRVTVHNFRGLKAAQLEFPETGREGSKAAGSVVVLGENGTGKTSLLQAAALGAMGPDNANDATSPRFCLTDGEDEGHVLVEFWGTSETNRVEFVAGSQEFHGHAHVPVMVLGYGAYRLSARGEVEDAAHYDFRVKTLFHERALVNGAFGLRQHLTLDGEPDHRRLEDAARAINAVLQGRAKARLDADGRLLIVDGERAQPLGELSSGFKSVVAITTDIMDVMYEVWDGMTSGQAFILVDEIDAHLHPSWRLAIVDALRETFPLAQFLMTTHDPLPLRGLGPGEIVVLDRIDGMATLDRPNVRGVDGMTVDQMLTSDLFGLDTTLDPEAARQLERYYSLLASPTRSAAADEDLEAVAAALPPQVPLGESPRERLLYRIIDRYLARRGAERADALSDESIDELTSLFEETEREILEQDAERSR
jgi:hypothetical protein